jgi:serine protease AprX
VTPAIASFPDVSAVELGIKFRADVAGQVTGIRFYKGALNTGTHVGKLWTETGTLVTSATFTKESATGWQEVSFATPVRIAANTTYVASYYAPNGNYAADGAYFATSGVRSGWLQAPAGGVAGPPGVYLYGAGGGFPSVTFNATNYWVDVVFTADLGWRSLQTLVSRAPEVWAQADQGQGITVAVMDSGIQPGQDLADLAAGVDLVGTNTALVDGVGHGTHVAGIIAGTGAMSNGAYRGVAPGARVLSVKVANSAGIATYSSMIKGLEWVVANRRVQNIRVVNLSLGTIARGTYKDDPLAAAAEMAWFSGVVVVASAGNRGPAAGTVEVPANDPYVVTVGAVDQAATTTTSDDTLPAWSGRGPTAFDNQPKPDLVAGGRRVISLRVPGSPYDLLRPDRVVDGQYFRLSGTSMAAPVISGAAALVLAANPSLTPNQVKYVLTQTAQPLAGAGLNDQGAGQLDALAAVTLARNGVGSGLANRGQRPSNVFARSIYTLAQGAPVVWRNPTYLGRNWSAWTWQNGAWDAATWDNLAWEQIAWERANWTTVTWESLSGWQNGVWVGVSDGALDAGALNDGALDDGALDGTTLD